MEAVKPLCDLCVRLGIFNSIMLSYQSSDDVFDTQLGVPYHCESKTAHHERTYHAYDGYTSPFEAEPAHPTVNLCRYCERHPGRYALFVSAAISRSEVTLRCPYCESELQGTLP
jgi:hypothetical protein